MKIPDDSFSASRKYSVLGNIYVYQKRGREAIEAFEKSLTYNYADTVPRLSLIRIYNNIDPEKAKEHQKELEFIDSFFDDFSLGRK